MGAGISDVGAVVGDESNATFISLLLMLFGSPKKNGSPVFLSHVSIKSINI